LVICRQWYFGFDLSDWGCDRAEVKRLGSRFTRARFTVEQMELLRQRFGGARFFPLVVED
jgi:hypothetical protein